MPHCGSIDASERRQQSESFAVAGEKRDEARSLDAKRLLVLNMKQCSVQLPNTTLCRRFSCLSVRNTAAAAAHTVSVVASQCTGAKNRAIVGFGR